MSAVAPYLFPIVTILLGLFYYFNNIRLNKVAKEAEDAKQQRNEFDKRIKQVELVDATAYPEFLKIKEDFKHLSDTVKIYHENRIEGIVKDNERQRDLFTMRFEGHERDIKDIKDCIKEIREDIKENTNKILEKIDKLKGQ